MKLYTDLIFIGWCIIVIVENKRPTWCHLLFLFHFLCAQHVLDINMCIIRSLRLFCWITTLVVCSWFNVCWCFRVVGLAWYPHCRLKHHCGASACNTHTTPTQPHRNTNTHRTKNNTTNVVIQQNSRKLLMMDILMSETCWAHKKWNKNSKWHQVGLLFSTIYRSLNW
jgi:hypothetical protein